MLRYALVLVLLCAVSCRAQTTSCLTGSDCDLGHSHSTVNGVVHCCPEPNMGIREEIHNGVEKCVCYTLSHVG